LQSLLLLDGTLWRTFKLKPEHVNKFIANMGGTGDWIRTKSFRNTSDTFSKNANGTFSAKTGMFKNWGGNPEYASVQKFIESLES
jgi:hypothetical protein